MDNLNNITLNITEIFFSLQGEAKEVGLPTVFVRLTGCPLLMHFKVITP
jgi:7-carboxy-7-deazaguanine synthase